MMDDWTQYKLLTLKRTKVENQLTLFKRLKKLKLSTAAIEEACIGLSVNQNASTSTTKSLRENMVKDKINRIMGERAQILDDIKNIVTVIEDKLKSDNEEQNSINDVQQPTFRKWIKYRKSVRQEINVLWIALRDRREDKIAHLIKKYPRISNRRQKRNKSNNIIKAAKDDNSEVDKSIDTIESLIDIENIKAKILNDLNNKQITDKEISETAFINDEKEVNLNMSYEDINNINDKRCLEQSKFFTDQIDKIIKSCKHEHNSKALETLQQCSIRIVGKVRKHCPLELINNKEIILKKRVIKKSLENLDIIEELISKTSNIDNKDLPTCNTCNKQLVKEAKLRISIEEPEITNVHDTATVLLEEIIDNILDDFIYKEDSENNVEFKKIFSDINKHVKNVQEATNYTILLENHMNNCNHEHKENNIKLINESCEAVILNLIKYCDSDSNRKLLMKKLNAIQDECEELHTKLIELNKNKKPFKCKQCKKDFKAPDIINLENLINWEKLMNGIKYKDTELSTIDLNELVIEDGIDVSENIKSLKSLASGFRTYKKKFSWP